MSFLGGRLELAEGARLTAIGLTPYSREAIDTDARVFMHRIRFDGDIEAVAAAEVLAVFVPAAIATLAGTEPDGGAWGAVIQYVPESDVSPATRAVATGGVPRVTRSISDAAIRRARSLTGMRGAVNAATYSDIDLRIPYTEAGAKVADWSAFDLMIGLLYQFASNVDLDAVVAHATSPGGPDGEQHPRAERLRMLLRDWSATNEGPRA